MARIKVNERVHLAWCCAGVIGCLVAYGVLQVRGASGWAGEGGANTLSGGRALLTSLQWRPCLNWQHAAGVPSAPSGHRRCVTCKAGDQRTAAGAQQGGWGAANRRPRDPPPPAAAGVALAPCPTAGAHHAGHLWRRDIHLLPVPGALQPADHHVCGAEHAAGEWSPQQPRTFKCNRSRQRAALTVPQGRLPRPLCCRSISLRCTLRRRAPHFTPRANHPLYGTHPDADQAQPCLPCPRRCTARTCAPWRPLTTTPPCLCPTWWPPSASTRH